MSVASPAPTNPGLPLAGNWATLLLPIDAGDAIDFARLEAELAAMAAAGVDGIYSNGTAGEFHNQTEDEFDRIQDVAAAHCRASGIPFVVGACHTDPTTALGRIRRTAALRPAAVQVILPDWWPVSDEEAADFLDMAAEAADGRPLILYNPPHAKRVLSPAELGALVDRAPTLCAIKLGDGDAAWYAEARRHLVSRRIVLLVPGHHLATAWSQGVEAGAFSNVACLSPRGAQTWTQRIRSDLPGALGLERRLQGFLDAHILPFRSEMGYSNAALDKLLAAIGDWAPVGTRLRRPYRWIAEAEAVRLGPIARQALPELFA